MFLTDFTNDKIFVKRLADQVFRMELPESSEMLQNREMAKKILRKMIQQLSV
jgi:hypothetical protein